MPIHYIPSDPRSQDAAPMYQKPPRPDRPVTGAHFACGDAVPEGLYREGTPEFLYWQCREAALATLDLWDLLEGRSLAAWHNGGKALELRPDDGTNLNAFYDRRALRASFYRHTGPSGVTYFGASTDIVAHEVGHALLDTVLKRTYDGLLPFEVMAFHEAFGDCVAFLTGVADHVARRGVLRGSPDLEADNFLETWGESLAACYREVRPADDPSTAPRHLRNSLAWQAFGDLPGVAPPGVLSRQFHVFGQVFGGCFYDTARNIFRETTSRDEAALLDAALTAGRLLVASLRSLPGPVPDFFRVVGAGMVAADARLFGWAHRAAIRRAFEAHGVGLETGLLGPAATLFDPSRRFTARRRLVPLDTLDPRLEGVVTAVSEVVPADHRGGVPGLLGDSASPDRVRREVSECAEVLLENDLIAFDHASGPPPEAADSSRGPGPLRTHAIEVRDGRRTLVHVGYACRSGPRRRE